MVIVTNSTLPSKAAKAVRNQSQIYHICKRTGTAVCPRTRWGPKAELHVTDLYVQHFFSRFPNQAEVQKQLRAHGLQELRHTRG